MNERNETTEFEVLGSKVKFKPDPALGVNPKDIIDRVNKEAELLKSQYHGLADGQIAVLVALKLAAESITSERDFKKNIEALQLSAQEALNLIEGVSPTAVN